MVGCERDGVGPLPTRNPGRHLRENGLQMSMTSGFGPAAPFRLEGQWWVPDRLPHRYVGGVLEYDLNDGLELRLFDALDPPEAIGGRVLGDNTPNPAVIHGRTFGGPSEVTLLGSLGGSPELPSTPSTYQNQSFRLRWALMGAHLTGPDPSFSKCWMSISGAEKWAGESGLARLQFGGRPVVSANFDWRRPDPIEVSLEEDDLFVALSWEPGARGDGHSFGELRPFPLFELASTTDHNLESWLGPGGGRQLRDLSSLLLQAPMQLLSFEVEQPRSGDSETRGPIEVVYNAHSPVHGSAVALPLVDGRRHDLADVIRRWFTLHRDPGFRVAMSRFFASGYRESFLEHKVSDVAAILEAMPLQEDSIPRVVADEVVESLLEHFQSVANSCSLPEQSRDIVGKRLASVGEPTYKQRVEGLVAEVHESLSALIRTPVRYASRLKEVRNPLAHGEELPIDSEEAFWLARAGHYVVTAVLLRRLGMDHGEIAEALRRVAAFRYACQVCSTYKWGVEP